MIQEISGGTASVSELQESSGTSFSEALAGLSARIPEIARLLQELEQRGAEIVDQYSIRSDFFEDQNRSLLFTSLVSIDLGQTEAENHKDRIENIKRRELVDNALPILFKEHSEMAESIVLQAEHNGFKNPENTSDDQLEALYARYTDRELSDALTEKIVNEGVFNEQLVLMGINPEDARPIKVNVLNFDDSFASIFFSREANGLTYDEIDQWARGLEKRKADFARLHPEGSFPANAGGFYQELNGQMNIFIKMSSAELLLAAERGIVPSEDGERKASSALSVIKHEYVHTQNWDIIAVLFGRNVDERRAEFISGDRGEYFDVKRFFNHLAYLTGEHINQMFQAEAAARRKGEGLNIYEQIANTYGLDMVAKIALSSPSAYVFNTSNPFLRNIMNALGGYDDIVKDYSRRLTPEQKADARARVAEYFRTVQVSPDFAANYMKPVTDAVDFLPTRI